jgi:hypothetical protein
VCVRSGAVRDGVVRDGAVRDGAARDGVLVPLTSSPFQILDGIFAGDARRHRPEGSFAPIPRCLCGDEASREGVDCVMLIQTKA